MAETTTPEPYNPIVRTFAQLRQELVACLGVDRRVLRPGTSLETLLPIDRRQHAWQHLRRHGFRLPQLDRDLSFPLGLRTLGDLVLYLTSVRQHRESGYRWTHNEIAARVRLIIAEYAGLPLDEVQPENSFADLGLD